MDPQPIVILDTPSTPILADIEIPVIAMEVVPEVEATPAVEIKEELDSETQVKMEVDSEASLAETLPPVSPPSEIAVQPEQEQKYAFWTFKNIAAALVASWADLKEVFRIPKKERVEQMKEHEREADKGSPSLSAKDLVPTSNYSYDRDG